MPRIADVLERESRTVDLEPGDFGRLLGRRERKQRNRRIRAGAVGVIVALATGIIFIRSLTSDRIPADRPVRLAPAPPGTLAYVSDGDVYVRDPDGSNAVKIADGVPRGECAHASGYSYWAEPSFDTVSASGSWSSREGSMWSPDGRYLAYRRDKCGTTAMPDRVVISDAAGNVFAAFPAAGWHVGWSPDSTRVAVWEPDSLFERVGVYRVDGVRQELLTMPSGWQPIGDHDPVWLPDGVVVVQGTRPLPLPSCDRENDRTAGAVVSLGEGADDGCLQQTAVALGYEGPAARGFELAYRICFDSSMDYLVQKYGGGSTDPDTIARTFSSRFATEDSPGQGAGLDACKLALADRS
jgi:hypothetical protein